MIETTVWCFMTSQDAEDLARLLREKERRSTLGSDLTAKTWPLKSPPGHSTAIKFVVDQERARQQGLMG